MPSHSDNIDNLCIYKIETIIGHFSFFNEL